MKSFDHDEGRRITIVPKTERYGAFSPKLVLEPSGRLLCTYARIDFEREVHQVLLMCSTDRGRTWDEPRLLYEFPGLVRRTGSPSTSRLSDGRLALIQGTTEETSFIIRWSTDGGENWGKSVPDGLYDPDFHCWLPRRQPASPNETARRVSNRIVETVEGELILVPRPLTKGRITQYRSRDGGKTWEEPEVIAEDPIFNLTEPSTCRLQDGRLMCILRENSYNFYPSYKLFSENGGRTWTELQETPMIGYELCLGQLQSSKVLVTYRHMGGPSSTRAWLGDPDDRTGFELPAKQHLQTSPQFIDDYLKIKTGGKGDFLQYHLHPPDNEESIIRLEAELRCLVNEKNACGIHIAQAGWVAIYPDYIELPDEHDRRLANDAREFRRYEIVRTSKELIISVDGKELLRTDKLARGKVVDNIGGHIPFGNVNAFGTLGPFWSDLKAEVIGEADWRSVKLSIKNPIHPNYEYEWRASSGRLPNQYEEDNMIEIDNYYGGSQYYRGETNWVQFLDGEIYVASHLQYDRPDGLRSSWLRGCVLWEEDFLD